MPLSYKCLIADDSMLDRDAVEMYVSRIDTLQIEAVCADGLEAANIIREKEIDIVFSDIDMPGLTGMELKESLREAPVFIFISSHAEYAAESFNLDVIDFIVKPVSLARLLKATNKAIEYIELKKKVAASVKEDLLETALPPATKEYFYIKESYDYNRINYANLVYIESMGNFSNLYLLDKKKHITLVSLKNIEQQLPSDRFMRVHKQFLVNLDHVISLSSEGNINLAGGYSVTAGESYKPALMQIINKNILSR